MRSIVNHRHSILINQEKIMISLYRILSTVYYRLQATATAVCCRSRCDSSNYKHFINFGTKNKFMISLTIHALFRYNTDRAFFAQEATITGRREAFYCRNECFEVVYIFCILKGGDLDG